ncbi:hypothetical protein ElyMa_006484300 [Elysia marginata]|uniref:Uncharacterized protein n=1 Tax=Elysia marginata TaxID=1093978 RepID=A0AAV4I242_9GAST|nr:hypothetical protein ElyMa_006484300 [Elysia marginata]
MPINPILSFLSRKTTWRSKEYGADCDKHFMLDNKESRGVHVHFVGGGDAEDVVGSDEGDNGGSDDEDDVCGVDEDDDDGDNDIGGVMRMLVEMMTRMMLI